MEIGKTYGATEANLGFIEFRIVAQKKDGGFEIELPPDSGKIRDLDSLRLLASWEKQSPN